MTMARRGTARLWVSCAFACAAAVSLAGCAESTLFAHTAKSVGKAVPSDGSVGGAYKVGNPYQIEGVWYTPKEDYGYREEGMASWYGPDFHGKRTANGELYDMHALTAAHRTLPMPCLVRVTNLENRRSAILRINDRGPFAKDRILDVSKRAADALGFIGQGTARVRVEILAEESIAMKERLLRGDSDFAVAPVQVASLSAVGGPSTSVTRAEELPPPPGATGAPQTATPRAVAAPVSTPVAIAAAGTQFIQVGAFGDPANASRLKGKLSGLGRVEVAAAPAANGVTLHKVRVGPFSDAASAQAALDEIRRSGFPEARLVSP
jgi:rare lipoprotein A